MQRDGHLSVARNNNAQHGESVAREAERGVIFFYRAESAFALAGCLRFWLGCLFFTEGFCRARPPGVTQTIWELTAHKTPAGTG
ncbi:hypothetical protein AAJCM20276_02230 [Acetobacter aceti]|uniref:Uncharacterized protein n=1 Tax=Acetobacter aceti TaxID=435 RepID=A0A6S6PE80_ACEAC|nr:hypothetical protein AAJCM20276_02230 [Acetobacter aceti]